MRKVLLFGDVRSLMDVQISFLKRANVEVLTAKDGVEALKKAKEERPDLILLAVEMPRISGLECCRILKGDPAMKPIPLVITTQADRAAAAREAGCDDILETPITEAALLQKIRRFLTLEVREDLRVSLSLEAHYPKDGKPVTAYTRDLSLSGCFIVARETLAMGSAVDLTLHLPTPPPEAEASQGEALTARPVPYRLAAVVTRIEQESIGGRLVKGMGLSFSALDPQVQQLIERLITPSPPWAR